MNNSKYLLESVIFSLIKFDKFAGIIKVNTNKIQ